MKLLLAILLGLAVIEGIVCTVKDELEDLAVAENKHKKHGFEQHGPAPQIVVGPLPAPVPVYTKKALFHRKKALKHLAKAQPVYVQPPAPLYVVHPPAPVVHVPVQPVVPVVHVPVQPVAPVYGGSANIPPPSY